MKDFLKRILRHEILSKDLTDLLVMILFVIVLFAMFICVGRAARGQDEDEQALIRAVGLGTLDPVRKDRINLRLDLESILLDRFVAPYDQWLAINKSDHNGSSDPIDFPDHPDNLNPGKPEHWYCLKFFVPKDPDGTVFYLKFCTREKDKKNTYGGGTQAEGEEGPVYETTLDYLFRFRKTLALVVEHFFICKLEGKDGYEMRQILRFGESHFYRLRDADQDPGWTTKDQLIY